MPTPPAMGRLPQILAVTALLCGIAGGANLGAIGGWVQIITSANLVAGAGTDIQTPVSISGATLIDLKGTPHDWVVTARRGSGPWNSGVTLHIRRTTAGTGSGSVTGGETFIPITNSDTVIFRGNGARDNIAIQYRLDGLTCEVPPGTYTAPITFTVD